MMASTGTYRILRWAMFSWLTGGYKWCHMPRHKGNNLWLKSVAVTNSIDSIAYLCTKGPTQLVIYNGLNYSSIHFGMSDMWGIIV